MAKIKKKLAERVLAKKSENAKKSINPFEVHINKQKYQVLGQKSKNDRGLPGVSRAKAIQKRKHTLLPEYNVKNKSNKFVDRRIGEKNFFMTEEDRTMARFTAERMKHHNKKSIYNLADDEVLTHRGQTLSEIEKFEDPRSDDDDDEEEGRKSSGKLNDDFVGDAHFGGGILTKTGKDGAKSHKDLIDQLIAESKKRKAEKQKTKEETLELTEKLDSEWKDLLPLVSKSNKLNETKEVQQKPDDYDKVMRSLKFEARGNPTDRLKSEDEIAKEEKERLEKLEQDRINRMKGITEKSDNKQHRSADDLDDNFNYDSEPEDILVYDEEGKLKNDVENTLKNNETNTETNEEVEGDESSDEEGSDVESENDDLSDLKQEDSDSDTDIKQTKIENTNHTHKSKNKDEKNTNLDESTSKITNENIQNIDQQEVKKKYNSETNKDRKRKLDESEIENTNHTHKSKNIDEKMTKLNESTSKITNNNIQNIDQQEVKKKCNSETNKDRKRKLDESEIENSNDKMKKVEIQELKLDTAQIEIMEKAKKELPYTYSLPESYENLQETLQNQPPEYQDVIIDRMIKCNHSSLAPENKEKLGRLFVYLLQHLNDVSPDSDIECVESMETCFAVLNSLTPHLYTLTQLNPENARDSLIEVIKEKQSDYKRKQKKYPGIDVLVFLKLISCLFSTSDFRHQVVTPSFVFISQMLTNCKVRTRYDIVYGLFLVTLFIEYTTLSHRYLPAVVVYLMGIIHMAVPKLGVRLLKITPPFKSNSTCLVLWESYKNSTNLIMDANDFVQNEIDEEFKIKALYTAVQLTLELQENWKTLPSEIDIFEPLFDLLEKVPMKKYPIQVQEVIKKSINMFEESNKNKKLSYLVWEKKKPKALRLYEPNIVPVYEYRKTKPMSREKAEREKLLHKYKKETKGALREIRRDKSFLGRVKIKQQIQSDYERKEKVKRIFGEASEQQSELNALDRKKKRM